MQLRDTIAAISTPLARSGIGVVRLSGPDARAVAERLLRLTHSWTPRRATLADLIDEHGGIVDRVVATFFEAPHSYTAEDVIEISCHGSPVVLRFCLTRACAEGARLAEPGEFTLRGFLNGRLDLPQAEAIRDLIDATTLYQARVAAAQAGGSVSRRIQPVKEQLLELIALLEAGIDFAEDDVSVATPDQILARLRPITAAVEKLAGSFQYGRVVHEGISLAIVGRPNVGKSSVFNALLSQDRAIVTDIPGTTRDLVCETADIAGIPVRLVDTAGIRAGLDPVEKLGIERSYEAMADADVSIVVLDGSEPITAEDHAILDRVRAQGRWLAAVNKSDLPQRAQVSEPHVRVSAKTGEGMDRLRAAIVGERQEDTGFVTSVRHEALLRETLEALQNAARAVEFGIPHEMLLLDLYAALRPIDAVTGATTADDILNRIFSTFCIGK